MCLSLWELYSWAPVSWWVLCCWWCMFHALIFPIYGRDTSLICRKKTFSPVILSPAKYHCKRVGMFILCWLQMSLFWCNYRAGIFLSRVQKGHMCISVTINVHAQAFFKSIEHLQQSILLLQWICMSFLPQKNYYCVLLVSLIDGFVCTVLLTLTHCVMYLWLYWFLWICMHYLPQKIFLQYWWITQILAYATWI